jgi:hypothetical protein
MERYDDVTRPFTRASFPHDCSVFAGTVHSIAASKHSAWTPRCGMDSTLRTLYGATHDSRHLERRMQVHVDFSHALRALLVSAALVLPAASQAGPFRLLFERNAPGVAGNELFLASFLTLADLFSGTAASSGFTQIDVNDNFNVAGLTNDASGYHMLFERNAPGVAGNELFLASFLTLADLFSGTAASSGFTQIDVNDNFNVVGFAADRDDPAGVPEPSSLALVALGLAAAVRWRKGMQWLAAPAVRRLGI